MMGGVELRVVGVGSGEMEAYGMARIDFASG